MTKMAMEDTYRKQSKVFLEEAKKFLAEGNLYQASEKGWGAAAQAIKAVAEVRGWEHKHHNSLQQTIDRLDARASDEGYVLLYGSANALHSNFYEGTMAQASVALHLTQVEHLIDKLERFLTSR